VFGEQHGEHVVGIGGTRPPGIRSHVTACSRAGRMRADLLAVGDLAMMRKQLLNLKGLAERSDIAA
jgi:hypothetical protein